MKGSENHKELDQVSVSSAEIERFRMVIDAAPNGILLVDERGKIILINSNAERMFAYDRRELDGCSMSVLIPARFSKNHSKHQNSFFAQPEARPMGDGRELFALRKDGSEFPVEIGLQPITSEEGQSMTMAVVVDISQRRRLQEERQQMEERVLEINENEQRRLGREIHDDLCQQLAAIGCLARVVEQSLRKSGLSAADSIGEIVTLVSQANVRAREISRGSAAAVLDADGLPVALEDLARLTSKSTGKKCILESEEGVSTGSLSVDLQLYRIAQEAVNNAVRHGEAKEIFLSLVRQDGQVTLTVADDGCGIQEESLQGMGMGLRTMTYRAVASGGSLKVKRRKPSGTEVCCAVPVSSGGKGGRDEH
ncbi:MAG: PAS domain S-box protein [Verrucomicrobia bacterium]|nr:PAS domain S-box protein [Verrucomicrobiota bacterium]